MARLVTFQHGEDLSAGSVIGDVVHELEGRLPAPGGPTGREFDLGAVRILPPVPSPPSVRDFFAFEAHVKTARGNRGLTVAPAWYELPVFYFSNPGATIGPEEEVLFPLGAAHLDYELEVAAIIGRSCVDVAVEDAWDYVAGLTVMNDWSARDIQVKEMAVGLGPSKGKDFATSMGPWLVTLDELEDRREGDRHDLAMVARVNGRQLSEGNLGDLYWTFPQMIAHASRGARLREGDVIGSGTVGTGCILELRPETTGGWLSPGDVVELEVERLGVLRNRIGHRPPGEESAAPQAGTG
jgi:fumarylacetoacetate (FAA) hydrolase